MKTSQKDVSLYHDQKDESATAYVFKVLSRPL